MALSGKREDLIHVPWSSVEEWLQVYKQIYSGDLTEQHKAYESLLVWKARIPKLPVGVECTLGMIQVCLRDREYTPKINNGEMSISYENDLRMMYSTVIMKFLNHISNIAHTKQTSLFVIAKQLNIPDWIVDLRHDIAHGHELPSIDVMRVVANILLTWLHEEYWAAEAKNLQETLEAAETHSVDSEDEVLINLIELWTAIGLYIKTKHVIISDLPDTDIRDELNNVFAKNNERNENGSTESIPLIKDEMHLSDVLNILLSEISKNLKKSNSLMKRDRIVIESILNNEAFLTNSEILSIFIEEKSEEKRKNCLPQSLIDFWKDFLVLLQEKKLLFSLFLQLLELINKENDKNRQLLASLWIKAIAQIFKKQKLTRYVYQTLEQKFDNENKKLDSKEFIKKVENEVEKCYPELKNVLSLNIDGDFPNCLTDSSFVKRLILKFNDFSEHYLPEISWFLECDSTVKEKLSNFINALAQQDEKMEVESNEERNKVYTIEDIKEIESNKKKISKKSEKSKEFADSRIRNTKWTTAPDNYNWSNCPIGILPWQVNDIQPTDSLIISPSEIRYAIVKNVELPKIVDSNRLKQHSKIQWENLMKKKKKQKRKSILNDSSVNSIKATTIDD